MHSIIAESLLMLQAPTHTEVTSAAKQALHALPATAAP